MKNEDREIIQRAAAAQGVANSRLGAVARAVLELDSAPAANAKGGSKSKATTELGKRVEKVEAAMKKIEVPDMAALEKMLADLGKRIEAIETALDTKPGK